MIASRRSARRLACAALALVGCATGPAGGPAGTAFDRDARFAALVPDVADRTAAEVARASLLSRVEESRRAVERLQAIDKVLEAEGERPTGLVPAARDLANAALASRRAYREATQELLDRDDLDPGLRARLEMEQEDDPLELAQQRLREDWVLEFARAFNRLAEPLGSSVTSFAAAPYRIARSVLGYALELRAREPLPLRQRQALAQWKRFVAEDPTAPAARALAPRVEDAEWRLRLTEQRRDLARADLALEAEDYRQALVFADRALAQVPEDPQATRMRAAAADALQWQREEQRRSLGSDPAGDPARESEAQRRLALALLRPSADAEELARAAAGDEEAPLADERRFAHALALGRAGREDEMWSELEEIASADPAESNMARHAAALVESPSSHPYLAFERAGRARAWHLTRWIALGPYAGGPRERALPRPIEWLVDLPSMAESVMSMPVRVLEFPWARTDEADRALARHAREYLARSPRGAHADELRQWLEHYETGRGNWLAALPLAERRPDASAQEIAAMREEAAAQWLAGAERERNTSLRLGMYRQLARELPETHGAHEAGARVRRELELATPQYVRLSRAFLDENPRLAGPECLALRPALLDGIASNGELHPQGVVLLGGSAIEVNYLARSGDPDDPPEAVRETLDPQEMARLVSALEEASFRNSLLDPEDAIVPDADRDAFFERLRLGLADQIDGRPEARSSYAYRGMSERYGVVRSRESILPFDLVFRGSLSDLSLGAFPRIHTPRETPDAFLYR